MNMRQFILWFSKVHILNRRTDGYNLGRIISIICFTKKPLVLDVNELSQTYEKDIFYSCRSRKRATIF